MNVLGAAVAVIACLACGACQADSSTQPSSQLPRLGLQPGPLWLTLIGLNFPGGEVPPCSPFATPLSGTSVKTAVLVTFEGNEWVVRSMSSAAGTLEMRFREVPVGFAQVDVRGTIRGAAFDMVSPPYKLFASETRALFGDSGPVDVSGHGDTSYSYAGGQMAGPIRFADSQGSTGECTAILWGLLPGPGL